MIVSISPQGQGEGRPWQVSKAQGDDGKWKESGWTERKSQRSWVEEGYARQLRETWISHTPGRQEACVLWFTVKWGHLWLRLAPSIKMELHITRVIFRGAAEECGPPCSMEHNKVGSRTLPTGVNCDISGVSQGKTRRTTPLVIKRRDRWRKNEAGWEEKR